MGETFSKVSPKPLQSFKTEGSLGTNHCSDITIIEAQANLSSIPVKTNGQEKINDGLI